MNQSFSSKRPAIRISRNHLPVDEIQRLLDEGLKQADVAELFGTTQPTISRLCRNRYSAAGNSTKKPGAPICTCCGKYTVAKGNRYLCSWCFAHEDNAPEYALTI